MPSTNWKKKSLGEIRSLGKIPKISMKPMLNPPRRQFIQRCYCSRDKRIKLVCSGDSSAYWDRSGHWVSTLGFLLLFCWGELLSLEIAFAISDISAAVLSANHLCFPAVMHPFARTSLFKPHISCVDFFKLVAGKMWDGKRGNKML